ncbi:glycerophosphoryl diester phosphodiesterase [Kineococcus xinjiangensis]|uniref:Glycerophosphoryl diester phosphodiesterase n=1 Tax=Kineococcus xinjiangensis TaxID=512762 RepID=A0A2S6IKF7_9ACTN|nr:glycerophosphodiester phosphodiesterase [Kineococcus xinjiangensis]PPK94714.1 glycerophosphoryl diester phosphodiesterase [Kineococcus xinjiangensis]
MIGEHPFLSAGHPVAMAHRGFSLDGLENTLPAFQAAVDLGYRYLETDVHATADGELVAFHDSSLDRVTDAAGRIAELPWSRVRQARVAGREPVPLLAEVLDAFPTARLNIDVKHASAIAPLVEVLRGTGARERVCVASFAESRRRAVVAALDADGGPPVATSTSLLGTAAFLTGTAARAALVRRVAARRACALQVPVRAYGVPVVTERFLARAHEQGLQVHVWTVDEPAQMHALLDLGVDGLITDRADLLRDVLTARGQWS